MDEHITNKKCLFFNFFRPPKVLSRDWTMAKCYLFTKKNTS